MLVGIRAGVEGRLLRLRYFESAGFDSSASDLGESNPSVRRHDDEAITRHAKRMRAPEP